MGRVRFALLVFAIRTAISVHASHIQNVDVLVNPPYPTASSTIMLRFVSPDLIETKSITRTGNHFTFDFYGCRITCLGYLDENIGTLPAGTYTYEVLVEGHLRVTGSFVVAPVPGAPTLSLPAMVALAAFLGIAAWIAIARR